MSVDGQFEERRGESITWENEERSAEKIEKIQEHTHKSLNKGFGRPDGLEGWNGNAPSLGGRPRMDGKTVKSYTQVLLRFLPR